MNKNILNYIEKCEGWKVGIKSLHWDAKNLSQHKLCDDIASAISDFEDLVSEVEQSISGKLKLNGFTPKKYKVESLRSFVEDVISDSKDFLDKLEKMGENYVGIKSECETFIGVMQRNLYLVNFTLKEELKMRLKGQLSEAMYKNVDGSSNIDKLIGRRPKSVKARINQIYKLVHKYGIDSRLYNDEGWQAINDYQTVISSMGCEVDIKPCADLVVHGFDSMSSDGGYTDYDANDNMPRSKQYAIRITFEDGMSIDGYIKCMAAGTVEDPFSRYDTCMVLWPKANKVIENKGSNMNRFIKEAVNKTLVEWGFPEGMDDGDNVTFDERDDFYPQGKEGDIDYSWDKDAFENDETPERMSYHHDMMDRMYNKRDRNMNWHRGELRNRDRMMNGWIHGDNDLDDIEGEWGDIQHESKGSMKVNESELKELIREAVIMVLNEKIEINPKNKGKFTATQKATGKSTEELTHSKNPLTRKRANFAKMAKRGWKPLKKSE